jgi:hypothetical protein
MTLIYPPVATAEYADKIAMAVERGVLRIMPHWRSREACQADIDRQYIGRHRPLTDRYVPTLTICTVAEDAGRDVGPPANSASTTERRDGVRVFSSASTQEDRHVA